MKIVKASLETQVSSMYKDYAISVIKERAIPNVIDGLKPVARKALYTMFEMGLDHKAPRRKVNTIGGATLKYSVHGNVSVEGAINVMASSIKTNIPLIDGQGNFGSQMGDPAAASRYCCTGDVKVISSTHGTISHSDLARLGGEPDENGYIDLSSLELRVKGENGKWVGCHKMVDSGIHKIYELELKNGMKIRCTPNHPVKVAGFRFDPSINITVPTTIWKEVQDLSLEDDVVIDSWIYGPDYIGLTKEEEIEAKFLGSMISEGCITKNDKSGYRSMITNTDKDMLMPFLEYYQLSEDKIKRSSSTNIQCYQVVVSGREHYDEMINKFQFGLKSKDRRIPAWVFAKHKSYKALLLRYLFEGDGSASANPDHRIKRSSAVIKFCSSSVDLRTDICWLLSEFGIEYTIYDDDKTGMYYIQISLASMVEKFAKEIGFVSKRKQSVIENIKPSNSYVTNSTKNYSAKCWIEVLKSRPRSFASETMFRYNFYPHVLKMNRICEYLDNFYKYHKTVSIKSIKLLPEKERVYSLVIDDPSHAYITNGILSHNTEARLSEYTCRMYFDDLFKYTKTIDWELNYDDTLYEPCYLPAKLPNLLINGCARGVAVGYTAAHVPHNPIDVINATVAYISNRDISTDDLIKIIKGPDFPTGGVINGMESVYRAYTTGKGSVLLRGKYKITEDRGYQTVSIFELPFGISTPTILEQIAKLADDNKVKLVKGSLHDHSDMNGVNIGFSIKKEEDVDRVMNCILKETDLETRIPISAYVIDGNNNLKLCTLKDIISEFISAREDMLHRKFKEEIEDRNKRIHLLNGLVIINKDMDNAISIIRKSKGKQDAKEKLMKKYGLDEEQANYILNMAVYRLSNMELQAILDEVKGLQKRVKELMAFTKTKSNTLVDKYMIDEMSSMKDGVFKSYKRRTKIQSNYEHISNDEIVRDEPVSLVLTQNGYIKKFAGHSVTMDMNPVSLGVTSDDEVVDIIRTSEAKTICVVTDRSHVFGFKVHSLDFNKRGKLLRNVVLAKDYENVLDWWEYDSNVSQSILTLSEEGMIKSTAIETNMLTNNGKLIMDVGRKGKLVGVALLDKNSPDTVVVATQGGQLLRFKNNIRNTGIGGIGVKAIKLKENDSCCGLAVSKSNVSIVSNHGNVKTINLSDIPCSDNRGGFGVIGYNSKDDHLIAIVNDEVGRYVCRTGNNILYEFSNNKPTKRTNKPVSLNIPSNFTINRVSKWR